MLTLYDSTGTKESYFRHVLLTIQVDFALHLAQSRLAKTSHGSKGSFQFDPRKKSIRGELVQKVHQPFPGRAAGSRSCLTESHLQPPE